MSTTDNLQVNIDQLAKLCNQYYSSLPPKSKPTKSNVMELIKWVSRTANNLNRDSVDDIRDKFFLITAEHGCYPILDQIRDSLIVIKGMQPKKTSTSLLHRLTSNPVTYNPSLLGTSPSVSSTELVRLTGPQPVITNIADMVKGLRDGSVPQPKVGFPQPRIVSVIHSEQFTPTMTIRAVNDEIDALRLDDTMFIVEPSMEPVTALMWKKLKVAKMDESEVQAAVEQYRLALVRLLEEDTDCDDVIEKMKNLEVRGSYNIRIGQGPLEVGNDTTVIPIHRHKIRNLLVLIKPRLDIEVHKRFSEHINSTDMNNLSPQDMKIMLDRDLTNIQVQERAKQIEAVQSKI